MNRITSALLEIVRVAVPLIVIGGAVAIFMEFGQKPAPAQQDPANPAPLVETASAEIFRGEFTLHADGVALPVRRMTLSAEVDGRVTSRSEQALGGRTLEVGTPLFEIDRTDHALAVRRLKAQLRQADEDLATVDVDVTNVQSLIEIAERSWDVQRRALARSEALAKENVTSDGQLDEAINAELSSRNALQILKNRLNEARQQKRTKQAAHDLVAVQLEEAETNLERTTVTSPIAGSVVSHHVELNDFVRRGDPLIEISDSSRIEVRCSLLIEQIYWIWLAAGHLSDAEGQRAINTSPMPVSEIPPLPVRVLYDFGGGPVAWKGVLWRYEGSGLDQQTRAVPCRILIENPSQPILVDETSEFDFTRRPPRLFTGMFVDIEIPIDPPVELLQIPIAVLRAGGQVWIVRDNMLHIEIVDVARVEDDFVLIRRPKSLRAGDRVIVSPLAAAQDGMSVRQDETDTSPSINRGDSTAEVDARDATTTTDQREEEP